MQIFGNNKFTNPIETIIAFDNKSFIEAFSRIEIIKNTTSNYLLGYIKYEAKNIFLGKKIKSKTPILYFEVFNKTETFNFEEKNVPLNLKRKPIITYKDYSDAIKTIKQEIAKGNTYEVNYTYDYKVKTNYEGFELYKAILPKQKTSYNAYIKNEYEEILSFSPELFFELEGNIIKTKPMKGTIKRGKDEQEDNLNIEFLKNDIKNRAENVMIVDLLRNDLGKIAKTGTVNVDKLFEIETHKTLHQMTSEISAELKENITFYQIFDAIFPCGSITGAPKISTMEIIDHIEKGKRGVYCGAIGLISPKKTVFSVPIRILRRSISQNNYLYRVGGAIVWDSTAKEEWEETLTKTSFLNSDYKIIETMLVEKGSIKFKKEHFDRMKKSAKKLGFKFNQKLLKTKPNKDGIMRVLLSQNGTFEIQHLQIDKIKTTKVKISDLKIDSDEGLIYHKTTYRPWYEETMKKIKSGEVFDEIFFNKKGELTEGARSNIILQIKGMFYTPEVKCGILNGILRQKLLKSGLESKKVCQKILYLSDLEKAEKIFCINSIRGLVEVQLEQ